MASGSSPGTNPSAAAKAMSGIAERSITSRAEKIGSIADRIAGRFDLKGASAAGALAVAVPLGLIWLIAEPTVSDMAAQASRVGIFERQGWGIWSGQWYAGHHLPGYSLLMPPLGALVGIWWAGFLAVCAASVTTALVGSRAAGTPRQAALIGSMAVVSTAPASPGTSSSLDRRAGLDVSQGLGPRARCPHSTGSALCSHPAQ